MAGRTRSRSRNRRPPLQPLRGIAPPTKPRPPLTLPTSTKAKSVGPVLPDISRQGPPHLNIHRTGLPAPKGPPELPSKYTPPTPKILVEYAKRVQPLPPRSKRTNELFAKRPRSTPTPKIRPTSRQDFQKAAARAQQGNDWSDFSPYVPKAERLPPHVSVFKEDGNAKWFYRYPQVEPATDSL